MEIDSAEPVPADRDTPVRVGCAPQERSCCFLLWWKFQLCSGTALRPTPGGEAVRCGNPWTFCGGNPYIQRNWKMVFAISGLHKVRPYSLPLSPFAISIPSLCGKCCCAVSVSRELPRRDGPVRSLDATTGCGAQGRALQGCGAVYSPPCAPCSPRGGCKKRKKIRGKCQANAFCWPAGSCVAGELFLVELAQWLCLPPLANFHKLLWNAGGSLELSGRGSELCTAALW